MSKTDTPKTTGVCRYNSVVSQAYHMTPPSALNNSMPDTSQSIIMMSVHLQQQCLPIYKQITNIGRRRLLLMLSVQVLQSLVLQCYLAFGPTLSPTLASLQKTDKRPSGLLYTACIITPFFTVQTTQHIEKCTTNHNLHSKDVRLLFCSFF